jgi:Domain of unknown function (DUF6285)
MRDRPNGAALLDVARLSLLEEVAPALKGQPRYVVLMVANAMGIAARELNEADRSRRAWDAVLSPVDRDGSNSIGALIGNLVHSLRSGERDGDAALFYALRETVDVAADIWKPAKPVAA